jgi:hypothetical protein
MHKIVLFQHEITHDLALLSNLPVELEFFAPASFLNGKLARVVSKADVLLFTDHSYFEQPWFDVMVSYIYGYIMAKDSGKPIVIAHATQQLDFPTHHPSFLLTENNDQLISIIQKLIQPSRIVHTQLPQSSHRLIQDDFLDFSLMLSVQHGHEDFVHRLLRAGANPNHIATMGYIPLIQAIHHRHAFIAYLLVSYHADVNLADHYGNTPLLEAIASNQNDMIDFLLDKGANPHTCNQFGQSSAILACCHKNIPLMKRLLAMGVDINITDHFHYSIYDYMAMLQIDIDAHTHK